MTTNINPHKTRHRADYVFAEDDTAIITDAASLAASALSVNNNDPRAAAAWLHGRGARSDDGAFGPVFEILASKYNS